MGFSELLCINGNGGHAACPSTFAYLGASRMTVDPFCPYLASEPASQVHRRGGAIISVALEPRTVLRALMGTFGSNAWKSPTSLECRGGSPELIPDGVC